MHGGPGQPTAAARPRTDTCARASCSRSPPAGATAPSSAPTGGRAGAARRLGRARAARGAAADPVGLAVGAPAHAPRTRSATCRCAACTRSADAVVTYGPHVSAYVRARGARNVHVAPQSVDNDFWRAPRPRGAARAPAGRPAPRRASCSSGATRPRRASTCCGEAWRARPSAGRERHRARARRTAPAQARPPGALATRAPLEPRARCATSTPRATCSSCRRSRRATFREPWGLVVNEAMNRRLAVIATRRRRRGRRAASCATARNGLVVPAGDAGALAAAIGRLARRSAAARDSWVRRAREDVLAYTPRGVGARAFRAALATPRARPGPLIAFRRSSYENRPPHRRLAPRAGALLVTLLLAASAGPGPGRRPQDHPAVRRRQVAGGLPAERLRARR